jgi:hypothetical protein|tara:strand:+ start:501 stop:746 length:246 start_codon:yes stop_codon:yes gene_type:complete
MDQQITFNRGILKQEGQHDIDSRSYTKCDAIDIERDGVTFYRIRFSSTHQATLGNIKYWDFKTNEQRDSVLTKIQRLKKEI